MSRKLIAHFVYSHVGKHGNIGIRTAKIFPQSQDANLDTVCVCRGVVERYPNVRYISMGWFGQIPRLMKAIYIYISPRFDYKRINILLFEAYSLWTLKTRLRPADISLAHIWFPSPRLIAYLKEKGVPTVYDMTSTPSSYINRINSSAGQIIIEEPKWMAKMQDKVFQQADLVLAPSEFIAKELVITGVSRDRIKVVKFGVDQYANASGAGQIGENQEKNDGYDYCFLGNICKRKGVPELIQAWVSGEFEKDRLHLCGRIFKEVGDLIKQSKGRNIITPGYIDPWAYLHKCDVYVLPTWKEGSAKSTYEAMMMGLPSIVTENAGSIIRDNKDGFVIAAGDVQTLREKMLWLKKNPEKMTQMGRSASEYVKDYTWESYSKNVLSAYENLLRQ